MSQVTNIFWNPQQRRLRALWRLILQSAAWIVLQFILGVAVVLILLAAALFSGSSYPPSLPDLTEQLNRPGWMLVMGIGDLGIVLLTVWLAGRFLDRRTFAEFGFHFSRRWWADFAFGLFLGGLLMAAIFAVESAGGWLTVTGHFQSLMGGIGFPAAILVPFLFFICVGIVEELSSRGYQLTNLAEGLNFPRLGKGAAVAGATIFSSVFFGLIHGANPNVTVVALINLMAAGVFLALGYVLTGELAIPIGVHVAWNFFQGNVFGFPVSGISPIGAQFLSIRQAGPDWITGGAFGPEGGLIGLLAMLLGSLLIVLWIGVTRRRVELAERIAEPPAGISADPEGPQGL
jgi:membrane protease YdiL (CAAX protease family)